MVSHHEYEPIDIVQLELLTEQESITWSGQQKKMEMVLQCIQRRVDVERMRVADELQKDRWSSQSATLEAMKRVPGFSLQNVSTLGTPWSDTKRGEILQSGAQLVIGRGDHTLSPDDRQTGTSFSVFIPAHVDVYPKAKANRRRQFSTREDGQGRVFGEGDGVYDMGAAVLNSIALAATLTVPKGMNVFFGFTMDEERDSRGALGLIKNWDPWPSVDIVLSSEIGHIHVPEEEYDAMNYILGRRGRQKFRVDFKVHDASQGHFGDAHVRSATSAKMAAQYLLWQSYYHGEPFGISKQLREEDAVLGQDILELGNDQAATEDGRTSSSPNKAWFAFSVQTVKRTMQDTHNLLKSLFRQMDEREGWTSKHNIAWTLSTLEGEEESYDPYHLPYDHPLAQTVAGVLNKMTRGKANAAYAPSVADENVYAAALKGHGVHPARGVVTIPVIGLNAHRHDECVWLEDMMRVREAMRRLIEEPDGLIQLRKYILG